MPRLTGYLISYFLRYFGAGFAFALTALVLMIVLQQFELVSGQGQSVLTLILQVLLLVPAQAVFFVPIMSMMAVALTFRRLRSSHELQSIHASGATWAIHLAVLLFGLAMTGLSAGLSHFAVPLANAALKENRQNINADIISQSSQPGTYVQLDGGTTLYIASRARDGTVGGFMLTDRSDELVERTYFARTARILSTENANLVDLRDGTIAFAPTDGRAMSAVAFERNLLALDTFRPPTNSGPSDRERISPDLMADLAAGTGSDRTLEQMLSRAVAQAQVLGLILLGYGIAGGAGLRRVGARVAVEVWLVVAAIFMHGFTGLLLGGDYGLVVPYLPALLLAGVGLLNAWRQFRTRRAVAAT